MSVRRAVLSKAEDKAVNRVVLAVIAVLFSICLLVVKGCMTAGHYELLGFGR